MKYVQIGILVCLASITVLLGAIYFEQRTTEIAVETPVATEAPALVPAVPEPVIVAVPAPEPPPKPRLVRANVLPTPALLQPARSAVQQSETVPRITPAPALEVATPNAVLSSIETQPVPPAPEPRTATLPAGLALTVRLDHTLSTERNQGGDDFQSALDEPLIVDRLVIAEKGARVNGRVVRADRAGRVTGRAFLALELTSLETQDGQLIAIKTQIADEEGRDTQKKDAAKIGIGAGIGAALGAIIGGGKGAAIGAATGAGAGAGTVAATRGEPVVLRPETKLEFRLSQPVTVTEQRF
jgi:hypothetical protein